MDSMCTFFTWESCHSPLVGLVTGISYAYFLRVSHFFYLCKQTKIKVHNELVHSVPCRLLELAARFSTRLIRSHGILQQRRSRKTGTLSPASPRTSTYQPSNQFKPPSHVSELARLLEVIRTLQSRLQAKRKGPSRGTKVLLHN